MTVRQSDKGLQSDAGFVISEISTHSILYAARRLSITIPVERTPSGEMLCKLRHLSFWDPPFAEPFTQSDKLRLRFFIAEAYRAIGATVNFDLG